jgi:hypothetical protein
MLQAGAVSEITPEMESEYAGPVHFVTIFPVFKTESTSTKLRLVSNAAMKNARCGLSLNDVIERGPDILNNLVRVLLH